MNDRIYRLWTHPVMAKWGRIGLLLLLVLPFFIYFVITKDTRNQVILIFIITALSVGVAASVATTEYYPARSLGLLGLILAADLYFIYLYLLYIHTENQMWIISLTRAFFVVSAPMFAVATVVSLFKRTRHRRKERRAL